MELRGGSRLNAGSITDDLAWDWQPGLNRHVELGCADQRLRDRDWFWLPPALLTARPGAGRTHLGRRLALAAGVPHVELDARDLVRAPSVRPDVFQPISPLLAIAISRCANPVVSVTHVEEAGHVAQERLASLLSEGEDGSWVEPSLGAILHLDTVTWLVQADQPTALAPSLAKRMTEIVIERPTGADESLFLIDLLAEVAVDHGIEDLTAATATEALRRANIIFPITTVAEIYRGMARVLGVSPSSSENSRGENACLLSSLK
ncbi:hypothetical protein [Sphingomonas sp. ABOLE]|uniref:hypothetical protein n=1 Tax=Sphingomonas sp. ABOLE TaxID=1985878 RepID=UPI000F7E9BEF|nr:hypothetical protein [Sphingomonas sp. ABOLE]